MLREKPLGEFLLASRPLREHHVVFIDINVTEEGVFDLDVSCAATMDNGPPPITPLLGAC